MKLGTLLPTAGGAPAGRGLFGYMPNDIWEDALDTEMVDTALYAKVRRKEASPLTKFYTSPSGYLYVQELSQYLYHKYKHNWERIWSAVQLEYNINETRLTNYERTELRTINTSELTEKEYTDKNKNKARTSRADDSMVDEGATRYNSADETGTSNRSTSEDSSGSTSNTQNTTTSDRRGGNDKVTNTESNSSTGTGSEYVAVNVSGVSSLPPSTKDTTSGTRNAEETTTYNSTNSQSGNTTDTGETSNTSTGSENTSDNKAATDRGSEGSVSTATSFGNEYTDGDSETTSAGSDNTSGTIEDEFVEKYKETGSSPLTTYQDSINDELKGRRGSTWNFIEIITTDVMTDIASPIWKREGFLL